jgi:hypothetical protein
MYWPPFPEALSFTELGYLFREESTAGGLRSQHGPTKVAHIVIPLLLKPITYHLIFISLNYY